MVFEGCFYELECLGGSLQKNILQMHEVEIKGDLILHFLHVAGMNMKELGMNGLSRGCF